MPSPTQITVQQLSRLIGTPDCPVIIDVRIDEDFDHDPVMIPTSRRHSHKTISDIAPQLAGKRVVVSCHKGKKLSEGTAALLRTHGVQTESLAGGHLAWREADEMVVPHKEGTTPGTLWVTRHRPKIDRIACPWLIRRFIDPTARFLFVAPVEVLDVADRFDAIPFDVEDVFWSHRDEMCTFDTMVEEFGLKSEAIEKLASIVRGADTSRHDLAPEAAGLLAVSLGLSRMYRDDLQQLDAGMTVYDALFRWARDATDETHNWPNNQSGNQSGKNGGSAS